MPFFKLSTLKLADVADKETMDYLKEQAEEGKVESQMLRGRLLMSQNALHSDANTAREAFRMFRMAGLRLLKFFAF